MFAKPITYSKTPMLPRVPNRMLPSQDKRKKLRILQDSTIQRLSAESMNFPKKKTATAEKLEAGGRKDTAKTRRKRARKSGGNV